MSFIFEKTIRNYCTFRKYTIIRAIIFYISFASFCRAVKGGITKSVARKKQIYKEVLLWLKKNVCPWQ